MNELFQITYEFLVRLSTSTGLSYKEVNVVIWYFLMPFSWACLLDFVIGKHGFKIGAACLFVGFCAIGFSPASVWLFDRSVEFLNLFNALGSNYVASSVIICLFVPVPIYLLLFALAIRAARSRRALQGTEKEKTSPSIST